MNKQFEMTKEQHVKLLDACKPTHVMKIGSYIPPSPQENANRAWQALANELGFIWDTVHPIAGKPDTFFTADIT